jgi:hypothetical protein
MKCIGCGCTDEHACEGGCSWAWPKVCSRCAHIFARVARSLGKKVVGTHFDAALRAADRAS